MPASRGLSAQYREVATDRLPPVQGFAFWRDACLKLVEPTGAPDGGYDRFRARSQRLIGRWGSFIDNSVTPVTVRRTPRQCARDGVDSIAVSLEIGSGGVGRLGAADKCVTFAPGELHVLDFRQSLMANWPTGTHRGLLLVLPRASLVAGFGRQLPDLTGVMLPKRGLSPLLAGQMRMLADLLPGLDTVARAAALEATVDLAIAALCIELGATKSDSGRCEDGMFTAAKCLINRDFGSHELSPDVISARLGCSRAHLYRLFGRHGMTVAGYIREVRLQRSRVALEAASMSRDTIGDIAFRCGFANPTHFTHLFAQRFDVRPREVRTAAVTRREPQSGAETKRPAQGER